MKSVIRKSLATLAVVSLTLTANAALIQGAVSISMSGTFTGGNINTATSFATLGPGIINGASGNFLTSSNIVLGPSVGQSILAMQAFGYGTSATPTLTHPVGTTWTTTNGGIVTSFTLTSITLVDHNVNNAVGVNGLGIFKMTGFDDTPGDFVLTANQAGTTFSLSASQIAFAPDGCSTAILLGLGLAAMGFAARRFKSL